MRVITQLPEWRQHRASLPPAQRVGFVPTMGALHAGHRALLERARAENDHVVLSIFVNPTQFDDANDLAKYPHTLSADLALAEGFVDSVFSPVAADLYPDHYHFRVTETDLSRQLEGAHRPGHFDGVLTVVLKLLQLVQPTRSYFGEKDWQQLQLVQGMARAFFLPGEIVACPTVRAPDGLALSSRHVRLSPDGRSRAAQFPRVMHEAPDVDTAISALIAAGFEVDYVEDRPGIRLGAIRVEGVRLIDHVSR